MTLEEAKKEMQHAGNRLEYWEKQEASAKASAREWLTKYQATLRAWLYHSDRNEVKT